MAWVLRYAREPGEPKRRHENPRVRQLLVLMPSRNPPVKAATIPVQEGLVALSRLSRACIRGEPGNPEMHFERRSEGLAANGMGGGLPG